MTKEYNSPELQIVRLDKNIYTDIIAVSTTVYEGTTILAPDRFDDWDAGY